MTENDRITEIQSCIARASPDALAATSSRWAHSTVRLRPVVSDVRRDCFPITMREGERELLATSSVKAQRHGPAATPGKLLLTGHLGAPTQPVKRMRPKPPALARPGEHRGVENHALR